MGGRIEELELLSKDANRFPMKEYQIVSIIGSQSSGKSTLLNALFGTDFEELNRAQRIGQTTKGIWFSVETPSNIIILDVEGSDSNEREERTVRVGLVRKWSGGTRCSRSRFRTRC